MNFGLSIFREIVIIGLIAFRSSRVVTLLIDSSVNTTGAFFGSIMAVVPVSGMREVLPKGEAGIPCLISHVMRLTESGVLSVTSDIFRVLLVTLETCEISGIFCISGFLFVPQEERIKIEERKKKINFFIKIKIIK